MVQIVDSELRRNSACAQIFSGRSIDMDLAGGEGDFEMPELHAWSHSVHMLPEQIAAPQHSPASNSLPKSDGVSTTPKGMPEML